MSARSAFGAALELRELSEQIRLRLAAASSLEEAAQLFVSDVSSLTGAQVALGRTYVAMPFYRLPDREREFALGLAKEKGLTSRLGDETPVLTLLGTHGAEAAWCDRRNSKGHVAIPLTDAAFVEAVPMVASLLQSLGVELAWFDAPRDVFIRRLVGGMNGVFFARDARTARDAKGRLVIPAAEFVEAQRIRTVLGVGGSYLNGWLIASIFFTRAQLELADADTFIPLGNVFKMGTMQLVASGRIFRT